MCVEYGLADCAGLEKREAQQHRISGTLPDSNMKICPTPNLPNQHSIDRHADHNEKALQTKSHEAAQVVVAHLPPFPVGHGSKGNCANRAVDVNFYHPPHQHNHHAEGQNGHGDFQQHRLHQQTEQLSQLHGLQLRGHVPYDRGKVKAGGAGDNSGALLYHVLPHLKDCHGNIKGVGDEVNGNERLENPFVDGEGFKVQCVLSRIFFI